MHGPMILNKCGANHFQCIIMLVKLAIHQLDVDHLYHKFIVPNVTMKNKKTNSYKKLKELKPPCCPQPLMLPQINKKEWGVWSSPPLMFSQRIQNTNKIKINPNKHGLKEEYEISTPMYLDGCVGPYFPLLSFFLKQGKHKGNLQELLSLGLEVWRQLEACELGITPHSTQRWWQQKEQWKRIGMKK